MFARMHHNRRFRLEVFVALWGLSSLAAWAQPSGSDWPQFLGPERNGRSSETGLIDTWPANGPKAGGVGMSGVAIQGTTAVTLVQKDGKQWLLALDAQTGDTKWETPLAPEYRNGMGNGPRGTPAISAESVYAFTGEGILVAAQLATGKITWSKDTVKDLGGKPAEYGMACSPLVHDGLVIVTVGGAKGTVAAYDMKSGQRQWATGDSPAGYSSPAVLDIGGRQQLIAFAGNAALGMNPASGKLLWQYPYETNFDCNIATPIAVDGNVFLSSGENHGSVLLALRPKGDKFDIAEVWKSQGTKSVLRNEWQTSILLDGYLYGLDNVGGAGPVTHLTCINAKTGERVWQKPRWGKGNLIAAEGKLFFSTMNGELVIARANPREYEEIGRKEYIGTTRQAPALSRGLLYMRDDAEIVCIDVRR
jgi:outer membrane protein assembly factor BamB